MMQYCDDRDDIFQKASKLSNNEDARALFYLAIELEDNIGDGMPHLY